MHTEPFPNLATLNNSSRQISDSADPVHRYVRDRDALWLWHSTLHRFGVRREMMTPLNNPMKWRERMQRVPKSGNGETGYEKYIPQTGISNEKEKMDTIVVQTLAQIFYKRYP
jgi:hypothetical protein